MPVEGRSEVEKQKPPLVKILKLQRLKAVPVTPGVPPRCRWEHRQSRSTDSPGPASAVRPPRRPQRKSKGGCGTSPLQRACRALCPHRAALAHTRVRRPDRVTWGLLVAGSGPSLPGNPRSRVCLCPLGRRDRQGVLCAFQPLSLAVDGLASPRPRLWGRAFQPSGPPGWANVLSQQPWRDEAGWVGGCESGQVLPGSNFCPEMAEPANLRVLSTHPPRPGAPSLHTLCCLVLGSELSLEPQPWRCPPVCRCVGVSGPWSQ